MIFIIFIAAHCFYFENTPLVDPRKYAVAVGKFYRSWENPKDNYAQYKQVSASLCKGENGFHFFLLKSRYQDKNFSNGKIIS